MWTTSAYFRFLSIIPKKREKFKYFALFSENECKKYTWKRRGKKCGKTWIKPGYEQPEFS